MRAIQLFMALIFFLTTLSAQEITDITFNKKQTHFFYIKNKDSLFVKAVDSKSNSIFITDGISQVMVSPMFRRWVQNDQKILIHKEDGLYVFDTTTKELKQVPTGRELKYFLFVYINQIADFKDDVYFTARENYKSFNAIYKLNLTTFKLEKIISVPNNHISNVTISKDGKLLAYSYFNEPGLLTRTGLHVVKTKSKKLIYQQKVKDSSFYVGLNFDDKNNLAYRDLLRDNYIIKNIDSNKKPKLITFPVDKHGYFIKYLGNSSFLTVKPENNYKKYEVFTADKFETEPLIEGSSLTVKSIVQRDNIYSVYATDENGKTPVQLYEIALNTETKQKSKTPIFSTDEKNKFENVHYSLESYENAGGGTNDAYFYLPENYLKSTTKIPMIIMVYGCYRDTYPSAEYFMDAIILDYVNQGYAVARLNTRGMCDEYLNDGYGKIQLADTEAFVDQIVKKYSIDSNKVIVAGHSHGATMVYYYMTHSTKFAAGLAFNGASDWVKQAHKKSITGLPQEMGGTPEEKPEKYKLFSPMENINANLKPMFIVTGAKDEQIPDVFNSKVFVAKARSLSLPVEYLCFEDEGHLFKKTKNRRIIHEKLDTFLSSVINTKVTK